MQTNSETVLAPPMMPADDSDLLLYPSMPFAYRQPTRIAALASLIGFSAPAAEQAMCSSSATRRVEI